MTISELEALSQHYFPSKQPQIAPAISEQGRAVGVTMLIDDPHRNGCYDNLESFQALRSGAPPNAYWSSYWDRKLVCPICKKEFWRKGTRRKYCSDACQQKAYRQRKKGAA